MYGIYDDFKAVKVRILISPSRNANGKEFSKNHDPETRKNFLSGRNFLAGISVCLQYF